MAAAVSADSADPPDRRKSNPKNVAKLRDGVMKRGRAWSYVIRIKDPETGASRPRWVGGFATEDEAKAARDEARVKARRGEYIGRNQITVTAYLDDWIDSHSMEIKPRTLLDYRACIRLYITPHIGHMPIQAVRPSTITKLYRDLLTGGGLHGKPLAVTTVIHLHAILRKAFRDAVIIDGLIGSNPLERAKRPRVPAREPGTVWAIAQLQVFLATARPAPAVRLLLYRRLHRSPPRRAAQPAMGRRRPRREEDHYQRLDRRGRGRADQRNDQERTDAGHRHR